MNVYQDAFEGSEKKLEIILKSSPKGLRDVPFEKWNTIVRATNSLILNKISTNQLDAYLLSESSLFVWDDRILMITCGQTTQIQALPLIIEMVGPENIGLLFYERKNLQFPKEQPSNFEDDVAEILRFYPGKSYRLGPANHDHVHIFYSSPTEINPGRDITLQVLMRNLPEAILQKFKKPSETSTENVLEQTGIRQIHHPMNYDLHFFEPYGFSINAIKAEEYYTIHVTPQSEGSYASFETNLKLTDFTEMVDQVLSIFRPQTFSIVLTNSRETTPPEIMPSPFTKGHRALLDVTEKSVYEFDCGYYITYLNFETKAAS